MQKSSYFHKLRLF